MIKQSFILVYFFWGLNSCESNRHSPLEGVTTSIEINNIIDSNRLEIDEIYSLLAYSIVYKDWQSDDRKGRGYNIGSILIDTANNIVSHALNNVNIENNSTQHGEVQLMVDYLDTTENYSLNGYTIYTTLEPCAMCAGMMTMVSVKRTVNGQNDRFFSKALERLSADSRACGGLGPYPRSVISQKTPSQYSQQLDASYQEYIDQGNKAILTKFLSTDNAKIIFEKAQEDFVSYKVKYSQNEELYKKALSYFKQL